MGQSKLRGLLALSVILALGSVLGWTKPALPDRPLQPGVQERVSGKNDQAVADPRVTEPSEEGGERKPAAQERGKEPVKPGQRPAHPVKPAQRPAHPEAEEETPAREEKNDCDDCVIVLKEAADDPDKSAGSSGMAGAGHLAGTLWGLFVVARPKRIPRTIIRGVTVP